MVEMILAIIGLVVGIISIPWLTPKIERALRTWRAHRTLVRFERTRSRQYAGVKAIQEGSYSYVHSDFMICEWLHEVHVDIQGDTRSKITCTLVNVSEEFKDEITFAVYAETPAQVVHGWAEFDGTRRKLAAEEWDSRLRCGFFRIPFVSRLAPRKSVRFSYGYDIPGVYSTGDEWWEWYFGRPHSLFSLKFIFDQAWEVSGLRASVVGSTAVPESPRFRSNIVYWSVLAPILGAKYRIDFRLSRT